MIDDPRAREDLKIVNEIRFGNVEAFRVLYDRYHKLVVFLCDQRCLNEKQKSDVVHEVFIRIWSAVHKFDESKAPFIAWFVCYARNIIITHLNKDVKYVTERNRYYEQLLLHRNDVIAGTTLTFDDIEEYLADFESEILGYRLVFGASFSHIAECVKMPEENVRMSYNRAIAKLKKKGYDVEGYERCREAIH